MTVQIDDDHIIPELPPGWRIRLVSDQATAQPPAKRWQCRLYFGDWNIMDKDAPDVHGPTLRAAVEKAVSKIKR